VPINLTGSSSPAVVLPTAGGDTYDLASRSGRWQLLVFHRHLG
jgi:hypothetical protein